jgi:parallel beta-helix repeat protein
MRNGITPAGRRAGHVAGVLAVLTLLAGGARPAAAVTNVTTFGQNLNVNGETYNMVANLSGSGNGLVISASNITLNMNGFALTGTRTGNGILVQPTPAAQLTNIHIHGAGLVQGFGNGIALVDTDRSFVLDVEVKNSEGAGVLLSTPTGGGRTTTQNTVHGVNSHNNSDGIRVESGASANTILSCGLTSNGDLGIALRSNNNWIGGNLCNNNSGGGMQLAGASGNFILGNRCLSNTGLFVDGIDIVGGSNNNRAWQNDCNSNSNGIAIAASTGNDLFGNTCNSNSINGISLDVNGNTNTVRRNTTNSNGLNGIHVAAGATGNTLTGNTALNNVSTINMADDNFPCANTWNNNTFGSAANRGGIGATCIS